MTEDARNSLIAFGSVTTFFSGLYLFLWMMKGVELPAWMLYAVVGLNILIGVINIARGIRKRVRRKWAATANS